MIKERTDIVRIQTVEQNKRIDKYANYRVEIVSFLISMPLLNVLNTKCKSRERKNDDKDGKKK